MNANKRGSKPGRHIALSICQPYASMIFMRHPMAPDERLKPIENREWRTDYRGPLWIHAGKSLKYMERGLADLRDFGVEAPEPEEFLTGVLLGRAELVDCVQRRHLTDPLKKHPTAEGPWCWVFERPRRLLDLIPLRGAQGLFGVPSRELTYAELEQVCRECGCTDDCACPEGCFWVEEDLCSACADREAT